MAAWQPQAGATLLIPSGSRGYHLFVLLNDPKPFEGYGSRPLVLLVNLSSIHPGTPHDPTCILQAGAHPFIQQTSFVAYRYARIDPADDLIHRVQQAFFQPHAFMPPEVFADIKEGLSASPFTKREFKRLVL
jgi:hypothetical protein